MKRCLWAVLACLLWATPVWGVLAQEEAGSPPALPMKARFGGEEAQTGGQVDLFLDYSLPAGAALADPPQLTGVGEGRLFGVRETGQGLALTLLVDELDSFHVGPVELAFTDASGAARLLASEPVALSVANNLSKDPAKQTPRPIVGLLPVTPAWKRALPWVLGGLGAALLVVLAVFFLRRKKLAPARPSGPPPHVTALADLEKLHFAREKGEVSPKEYYFSYSLILRVYMEAIRDFPAAEMTYEELNALNLEGEDRKALDLLREAEAYKFAGQRPMERAREDHYLAARDYIHKTSMPREEDGQPGEEAP